MNKVKRILCPVDLSTEWHGPLLYAVALARAYQAKLILLYCRKLGSFVEWTISSNAARLFQQALFTLLDADTLKTVEWEPAIAEADDIGRTIISEAAKREVDLIVMQSRRRPRAAALLGSTAETVSRGARCPVLVTHADERDWAGLATGQFDLKRILVSHDFSAESALALQHGLSLAQEKRTELHLLNVLDREDQDPPEFAWAHVDIESRAQEVDSHLQESIPREARLRCTVVTAVRWGYVAEEIVAYARDHKIDLICIGARGRGFDLNTLFGSATEHVLRRAECPVLVAQSTTEKTRSAKAA